MRALLKQHYTTWSLIMRTTSTHVSLKLGHKVYSSCIQNLYSTNNALNSKKSAEQQKRELKTKNIEQHHYIKNEKNKSNATPLAVTQAYYLAIAALILILFIFS